MRSMYAYLTVAWEEHMDRRPHITCTPSVFLSVILVTLVVTSAATHAAWPNLDVLQNYPKPGVSCSLRGAAPPGSEKAKSNALYDSHSIFEPILPRMCHLYGTSAR